MAGACRSDHRTGARQQAADRTGPCAWLLAAVAGLLCACAPALRVPPPVDVLGRPAGAETERASPADVDRLLAQAEAEFGRRPDMAAIGRAYQTFLAAARADETRVDGLVGAARAAAWIIEHENDGARRGVLATEAVQACQWCLQRAPSDVVCTYRLALALGQQSREHRTTAKDGLSKMIALLEQVVSAAPAMDGAGGHRVLALVLLRAPGWPAGPGDQEAALDHARQADRIAPENADNLLVLGEALAENGEIDQARRTYVRARQLAAARAQAGDPDAPDVVESAERALRALSR